MPRPRVKENWTKPPEGERCIWPSAGTYSRFGCRCPGCRDAHRLNARRYYRKTHTRTSYSKGWTRLRRKEIQARLAQIKLERGCADCGYREHAVALDFDHLRDKEFSLSRQSTLSWERLEAEIAKCDVVCANCHRVRTWITRKQESNLAAPCADG